MTEKKGFAEALTETRAAVSLKLVTFTGSVREGKTMADCVKIANTLASYWVNS
jgi:hypothetical protein